MKLKKRRTSTDLAIDEALNLLNGTETVESSDESLAFNKFSELVNKYPEQALSIVRSWMYQEI